MSSTASVGLWGELVAAFIRQFPKADSLNEVTAATLRQDDDLIKRFYYTFCRGNGRFRAAEWSMAGGSFMRRYNPSVDWYEHLAKASIASLPGAGLLNREDAIWLLDHQAALSRIISEELFWPKEIREYEHVRYLGVVTVPDDYDYSDSVSRILQEQDKMDVYAERVERAISEELSSSAFQAPRPGERFHVSKYRFKPQDGESRVGAGESFLQQPGYRALGILGITLLWSLRQETLYAGTYNSFSGDLRAESVGLWVSEILGTRYFRLHPGSFDRLLLGGRDYLLVFRRPLIDRLRMGEA